MDKERPGDVSHRWSGSQPRAVFSFWTQGFLVLYETRGVVFQPCRPGFPGALRVIGAPFFVLLIRMLATLFRLPIDKVGVDPASDGKRG